MADLIQFLKSQGASDEDVKALTEGSFAGAAKRAFEAAFAKADAEAAARKTAEDSLAATNDWYNNVAVVEYNAMKNEAVVAKAEEARAKAALMEAQRQGLVNVTKDLGYDVAPPVAPPAAAAPADAKNYMTRDEVLKFVDMAGEGIAAVEDISAEHRRLFPDRPFNARELRREAIAAKQPFEAFWMAKYGVAAARDAAATADRTAYEKRLRDEGAAAAREQFISEGGNPNLRVPLPSQNVFAPRKAPDGSAKQPWERGENEARFERVKHAMDVEAKSVTQ